MTYAVKEIFYTLQGEGANAGRPAVFCRFAGCNLWTGREERPGRRPSASSATPTSSAPTGRAAASSPTADDAGRRGRGAPGRPATCRDAASSSAPAASRCCSSTTPLSPRCTRAGFEVAVETNGTLPPPPGIDWICVSPKAGADARPAATGDELKLVYPQAGAEPERFERLDFRHFFLQPMDGPDRAGQHRGRPALLPGPSALAAEPADPQVSGIP